MTSATKETIHRIVDGLSEEDAEELLDYLNMSADPDELTGEELAHVEAGQREIERGEFVTLDEIRRRLTE